jgi:CheY-like chemotaxis protein
MKNIYPYYHPTKVVLVDDDIGFLNSLGRQLNGNALFRCFSDIKSALTEINAQYHPGIYESCRGTPTDQLGSFSAQLVPWDFSAIIEQALNEQRFQETSIAVIDYYMPSMDGLQLCNQIQRPEVRKVLLTGVFDTSDAINALNDDVISAYLNKNDANLSEKVNTIIDRQQQAYFTEVNKRFYASGADIPEFLTDSNFIRYFSEIYEKHNICEYYLSTDPYGIFMLGSNKRDFYQLLVYNDAEMRAQWEIAESQYAPAELVKKLATNNVIPNFWKSAGVYDPMYALDWQDYVFEPTPVISDDQQVFYCHLLKQPSAYRELIGNITDFDSVRNASMGCG